MFRLILLPLMILLVLEEEVVLVGDVIEAMINVCEDDIGGSGGDVEMIAVVVILDELEDSSVLTRSFSSLSELQGCSSLCLQPIQKNISS